MASGLSNVEDGGWSKIRHNFARIKHDYGWIPSLSGLTASRLLATDASKKMVSSDLANWIAGTANEVDITDDGDGTITIGIINPLIVAKGGTGAATLTDGGLLLGSGTGAVTVLAQATNGQLPIGSTGADPVLAGLTGTANQVTVTNAAGSITLATPQDIHTGASPTFVGLTLTANLALATTTSSSTGVITKGGNRFFHDFHHPTGGGAVPLGRNIFVGKDAGNYTAGSTATQVWHGSINTGVGEGCFASLTIGYNNAAFGNQTLASLTTSHSCTAFGTNTLNSLISGIQNNAIGYGTLYSCTTSGQNNAMGYAAIDALIDGSRNCGVGSDAIGDATSCDDCVGIGDHALANGQGDDQVGIGSGAGRYITGGSTANINSASSVYIGMLTKANADGDTNEIVIGYDATGAGTNTATLGNTSITSTVLRGVVSCPQIVLQDTTVDTTVDYCGLHINQIKTDGATDQSDYFAGLCLEIEMNDADSTIGDLRGVHTTVTFTAGSVGTGGSTRDMEAGHFECALDGGTVTDDVFGVHVRIDQGAGNTISGDAFGIFIVADYDGTLTGTGYMLYLSELSNVDYGVYQSGTAPNVFGGAITASNYTAANLLTACATNAGALDFSAASKTLTVEDDAVVSQDYSNNASPQFTGIELGHTSDTTLTRVSAGVVAIEGTSIAMVGAAPTAHVHDGDTLQLDAVSSNGGAFAFTTTGAVTFNQDIVSTQALVQDNANTYLTVDTVGANQQAGIKFAQLGAPRYTFGNDRNANGGHDFFIWDTSAIRFVIDATTTQIGDTTNRAQFSVAGDLSFVGTAGFYPRVLNQAAEPAAGTGATQCDTGEAVMWTDTDDAKCYLCYNHGGVVKTVELV